MDIARIRAAIAEGKTTARVEITGGFVCGLPDADEIEGLSDAEVEKLVNECVENASGFSYGWTVRA